MPLAFRETVAITFPVDEMLFALLDVGSPLSINCSDCLTRAYSGENPVIWCALSFVHQSQSAVIHMLFWIFWTTSSVVAYFGLPKRSAPWMLVRPRLKSMKEQTVDKTPIKKYFFLCLKDSKTRQLYKIAW